MATASSPPVLGLLAHDLRWAIVGLLAEGDLRTGELVARTRQAPSLVSYHLGRLRDAGLVSARRSTADGRDTYHALDLDALGQAVAGLAARIHPGLLNEAARSVEGPSGPGSAPRDLVQVLFICTGNSARSPMAAGWLNHLGDGRVTARCAGIAPVPVHPLAVAAMAEHGVDIAGHRPTRLNASAFLSCPSDRSTTDRGPCTPLPVTGAAVPAWRSSGGQVWAHAPAQLLTLRLSLSKR